MIICLAIKNPRTMLILYQMTDRVMDFWFIHSQLFWPQFWYEVLETTITSLFH